MLESNPRVSPLSLGSMWSAIRIEPRSITLLIYYYFYFWLKKLLFYCTIVTPVVFFNGRYTYLMLILMRKCYLWFMVKVINILISNVSGDSHEGLMCSRGSCQNYASWLWNPETLIHFMTHLSYKVPNYVIY